MPSRSLMPYTGGRSLMWPGGLAPFGDLQREMNRLFEDVFGRTAGELAPISGGMAMTPRMDVCEMENELRVCAEIPGVAQNDVEVTVDDDILTIRGEKKAEADRDRGSYHVSERSYGRFQRAIQLPFSPDPDKIHAAFENGVLTVTVPRTEQARQRARRIAIESGTAAPPATKEDTTKH